MGTMVIALDPQGNPFGLWQSGFNTGVQIHNEPGALAWNEAMVDDTAAAKAFYTAVFGFTFDQMDAEMCRRGMDYSTFSTGGQPAGWSRRLGSGHAEGVADLLRGEPPPTRPWPRSRRRAARSSMPAMDTPFGRFAIVEDPWGAPFEVMGPAPAA